MKGHKKPDSTYYKAKLERKNTGDKKKKNSENEAHHSFKNKDKENANVAFSIILLRSQQMQKIFLVILWQQIMLKLMMLLFIFMHRICRLERAI